MSSDKQWETVFHGAVAAFLVGISSIVFGQTLLFGELVKPVTLFYQEHFSVDYPANVTENLVVEICFNKIAINLSIGVIILAINYFLKGRLEPDKNDLKDATKATALWDSAKNTRETVIFILVVIGFAMWTIGYMVIGWIRPTFAVFLGLSIGLISFGGGFVVWGSIILITERISVMHASNTWQNRIIMGLFASGPPIYILVFFPVLQSIIYDTASESFIGVGNGSGEYPFYIVYQTIGTIAIPLLVVLIGLLTFELSVTNCGCRRQMGTMIETVYIQAASKPLRKHVVDIVDLAKAVRDKKDRKRAAKAIYSFVTADASLFIVSRALFSLVFFSSVMMFSNYVMHSDKTVIHSFDLTHKNVGFVSEAAENYVVRTCILLIAAGGLVGRLLYGILISLPELYTDHDITGKKFVTHMTSKQKNGVFFIGWISLVISTGVMWGWYARAKGVDNTTYTMDLYFIAFFIGFSNSVVFLDSIFTVLFYFNIPDNRHNDNDLAHPYARTRQPDAYLLCLVILMLPGIISARFSSGMFGNLSPNGVAVIDYVHFTMILAILATISMVLQTILVIVQCCRRPFEEENKMTTI